MKRLLCVLSAVAGSVLLISLTLLSSFPTEARGAPKSIRLSAGAMGQSIYMLLAVLAKRLEEGMPGVRVNVVAGGGKANPKLVSIKKVDIAFTVMGLYKNAILGRKPAWRDTTRTSSGSAPSASTARYASQPGAGSPAG